MFGLWVLRWQLSLAEAMVHRSRTRLAMLVEASMGALTRRARRRRRRLLPKHRRTRGEPGFAFQGFEVNWETCSLHDGQDDGLAECAAVEMPLNWSNPDGQTIQVAAKRFAGGG